MDIRRTPKVPPADPRLQDPTALAEIALYSDVLIAAAASDAALSDAELDDVLGVRRG